jgi:hypothetical protein
MIVVVSISPFIEWPDAETAAPNSAYSHLSSDQKMEKSAPAP